VRTGSVILPYGAGLVGCRLAGSHGIGAGERCSRRVGHGLGIASSATAAPPPFTAALALELAPVRVKLMHAQAQVDPSAADPQAVLAVGTEKADERAAASEAACVDPGVARRVRPLVPGIGLAEPVVVAGLGELGVVGGDEGAFV
jgi:hypothetical protein